MVKFCEIASMKSMALCMELPVIAILQEFRDHMCTVVGKRKQSLGRVFQGLIH